jgi:4-amino-4-deoxy-L-arabinose transferase-like glycosyltransferase
MGRRRVLCVTISILLITIGAARIILTYTVFTATSDEPLHIAAGMRWLEQREYMYDHPPLARVAAALPLYIAGLRSTGPGAPMSDGWGLVREGNEVIYSRGAYEHNLSLARLAVLPFFLIACLVVWLWTERLFGGLASVMATILFTTLPAALAHGSLATTDMAVTATLICAVYAYSVWLEGPNMLRGFLLGFSLGLSVLSKFSALMFFPVCCLVMFGLYRLRLESTAGSCRSAIARYWKSLVICCAVAFLTVWAGYRFSLSPITTPRTRPHVTTDRIFGDAGLLHDIAYSIVETPIPVADLINGLLYTWDHNAEGHPSYLLGEFRTTGWWYFFPVVLAVKTPVPFLLFYGFGLFFLIRQKSDPANWQHWVPALCPLAILLVCMTSRINIGVRHLLPMFPMLAIVAGYGAARLIEMRRRSITVFLSAATLLLWQFTSSALAHPDYLAYFNEIAEISERKPEQILIDSDLDWGQDLNRLRDKLRELKVNSVSIAYFGTADLNQHGLPAWKPLIPNVPTTGWIAVSVYRLKMPYSSSGRGHRSSLVPVSDVVFNGFSWLEKRQPITTVGKTIRLYFIPSAPKKV